MNTNLKCTVAVALMMTAGYAFGQITLQNAYDEFLKTADVLKEGDHKAYYTLSGEDNPTEAYEYSNPFKVYEIKRENGKVVSFKMDMDNYSSRTFIPNHKETPFYWKGDDKVALIYKEHVVILDYGYPGDESYKINKFVKIGGGKKGLFQGMFATTNKIKIPFTKEELNEAAKPFIEVNKQRLENERKNKEAAAAAHREKYSIKGKDVAKIDIEASHGAKLGHGSKFSYGIVATLKDGTVIKTKNIGGEGYIDDYDITVHGDIVYDNVKGYNIISLNPYNYKGDYIQIAVKSKHHPSLPAVNKKYVLTYDEPVKLDFTTIYTAPDNGYDGPSLRIDVKAIKHSETNEDILEYRVYDSDSKLVNKFRLKRDVLFKVISNGGAAQNKTKDSQCGNGGNGGNITLNLDPSVGENYQFDYENRGGKGGTNKDNALRNGMDGRDGRFTKNVKTIN